MSTLQAPSGSLTLPIVSSAILHVAIVALIVYRAAAPASALPPLYRVELVAAPAGPRAEGVVTSAPAPETPAKATPAPESKRNLATTKAPAKKAPKPTKAATPNSAKAVPQTKAPPVKAGGGEQGSTGNDVASVLSAGIDFPFPGYLTNVVRQVALQFEVPRGAQSLTADVSFLIHRDGTVTAIRMLSRSGSYVFDQACLTAVEAAGRSGKFNHLPDGFTDDVLPVIFSFDPKRMR